MKTYIDYFLIKVFPAPTYLSYNMNINIKYSSFDLILDLNGLASGAPLAPRPVTVQLRAAVDFP